MSGRDMPEGGPVAPPSGNTGPTAEPFEVLHQGFDNLDLSFCVQPGERLVDDLEAARRRAVEERRDQPITVGGVQLMVADAGGAGGYCWRGSTGDFGGTWFFKRPNPRDPWGVRLSANALPLATRGADAVYEQAIATLADLGMRLSPDGVRVSRVDYALDVLAPAFEIQSDQFVMHSRMRRADQTDVADMRILGRSSRTTSVTIGKMPGKQVILYDKRQEVLEQRKMHWLEIWNANRRAVGGSPLDFLDRHSSRVIRIEGRAGRKALRSADIDTWADFRARGPGLYSQLLEQIRYCLTSDDRNRSRWPNHPVWDLAQKVFAAGLAEISIGTDEAPIRRLQEEELKRILMAQFRGSAVNLAALDGCTPEEFQWHLLSTTFLAVQELQEDPFSLEERLERSRERYGL